MRQESNPRVPLFRPYNDRGVTLLAYAWFDGAPSTARSVEPDPGSHVIANYLIRCNLTKQRASAVFTVRAVLDDPDWLSVRLAARLASAGVDRPEKAAAQIVERAERDLAFVIDLASRGLTGEPDQLASR